MVERLAWLWGTYGVIREYNMFGLCRGEDAQPTAVFKMTIWKMDTTVSMTFYKARFVEVTERGYTILPDFADPTDPDIFRDVILPFDVANDAELEGKTQLSFFQAVLQTLKRKEALEVAGSDELNWKTIFNHAIDALDEADRRKGLAMFSTTQRIAMVTMLKSWIGRF